MWLNFRHFARVLSRNNRRTISRRPRVSTCRPRLEALEDRCLLSGAGSLDPTFGNGAGYVTTSTSSSQDIAHSVLIQPNGDIIALGRAGTSTGSEFAAVRYNPDGSLDTSFGSGGIALASFGSNTVYGPSAALYPAGTPNAGDIVQAGNYSTGSSGTNNQVLVRYTSNGTLDPTFGTGGEVVNASPINYLDSLPSGVVITSTGQIVTLAASSRQHQFMLTRFNANGSLDTTFGQGGYVITTVQGDDAEDGTLLQQPNGDLIVTAESGNPGGTGGIWNLYRFNANGTPDTSFGNQGVVSTVAPGGPEAAVLYPNAGTPNDGQIVDIGQGPNGMVLLARYNTNGSLDTTFGTGGLMQTQVGIGGVLGATLDANGRIVVSGANGSATEVARFNVDGTPDISFGSGGVVNTTFGTSSIGWAVAIYPNAGTSTDGDIVVVGSSSNGTKGNVLVARYLGQATSPYFVITGSSSVTAGTAGTYTISVFNPDGSADTGYSGTVHITSSDPKAVLPADFTISGASATFSATLKTAGVQSLTATDTGTPGINGSDANIRVNPAAASQFILSAPSSVKRGARFSVTLTVEDAFGNVVTGYVGTVHFTSSDSTATLPTDYTFTAGDAGVHTFTSNVILRKRATQTLSVTDTQNSALTTTDTISVM
jgi:uncharacterized delta-60 repeat protein